MAAAALGWFGGLAAGVLVGVIAVLARGVTTTVTEVDLPLWAIIGSQAVAYAGMLGGCWWAVRSYGMTHTAHDLGITIVTPRLVGLGLAGGVVTTVVVNVVGALIPIGQDSTAVDVFDGKGVAGTITLVVFAGLLAPIVEELFFRGLVQTALVARFGPLVGIGLTAFAFGLVHLEPANLHLLAIVGVALGWLRWRYRSLWPSMIAHATFNSITLIAYFAS